MRGAVEVGPELGLVERCEPERLDGVAHVGAVFVSPAYWRQGIARRMLGLAEDAMRARKFGSARLWTPEGAPAERLYSALGWERDGRRMWHDWVGVWVVGYSKAL